jgi:2-polyprenyl-3-methyl-5-hydroxy-6-metoxy-1,4-benzoquinol methylase
MNNIRKPPVELGELFTGIAHAEKYQSKNLIANFLIKNFLKTVLKTVQQAKSSEIFEIGCGEGHILGILAKNNFIVKGCDISETSLAVAKSESERLGLSFPLLIKSIYDLDASKDKCNTVLCCEVLEHLTDPEQGLRKLISITEKNLILSVPREPLWHILNMARGKYLNALGNTPGHFQHWTLSMFINLVDKYAEIVSVKTPLPWILIHCRPKNKSF